MYFIFVLQVQGGSLIITSCILKPSSNFVISVLSLKILIFSEKKSKVAKKKTEPVHYIIWRQQRSRK